MPLLTCQRHQFGAGEATTEVDLRLHHGVIFRPMGETVVTGSGWTVCTSINLTKLLETYTLLKGHLGTIEDTLDRLEVAGAQGSRSRGTIGANNAALENVSETIQGTWRKLTATLESELEKYKEAMSELYLATGTLNQTRTGRGLINIVSDAGKYLFGFSTEKEVKQLKEKIDVLAAQSGNLTHMADQQF